MRYRINVKSLRKTVKLINETDLIMGMTPSPDYDYREVDGDSVLRYDVRDLGCQGYERCLYVAAVANARAFRCKDCPVKQRRSELLANELERRQQLEHAATSHVERDSIGWR